jgi:hypothetical protein
VYSFGLAPSEYNIFSALKQNLGFHKIKRWLRGGDRCDTVGGHKTRIAITTEQKYLSHDAIASIVASTMLKSSRIALRLNPDYPYGVGRDSVVSLATHCGLDGPGIKMPVGARFSALVQNGPGTHSLLFNGYRVCSLGVKKSERGHDTHLHPAPKLTKEWSCTSTPPPPPLWAFKVSYMVKFKFTFCCSC